MQTYVCLKGQEATLPLAVFIRTEGREQEEAIFFSRESLTAHLNALRDQGIEVWVSHAVKELCGLSSIKLRPAA